jgi:hypothetical protein
MFHVMGVGVAGQRHHAFMRQLGYLGLCRYPSVLGRAAEWPPGKAPPPQAGTAIALTANVGSGIVSIPVPMGVATISKELEGALAAGGKRAPRASGSGEADIPATINLGAA